LDRYLLRPFWRAPGMPEYARGVAIDTGGHHTAATYDFCGPRFRRTTPDGGRQFVFAVKGAAGAGELWPKRASRATTKVPLWTVRVDAAKEQIYGRLGIATPSPGYVHFPLSVDANYMRGLTSEMVVTTIDRRGFPQRAWKKKNASIRNEPLDCAVYGYAALVGLRSMGFDMEAETMRLHDRIALVRNPPAALAPSPRPEPQRPRPRRATNSWLGDTSDWLRR
jgi:phage terminase large subunit GpA-like protein